MEQYEVANARGGSMRICCDSMRFCASFSPFAAASQKCVKAAEKERRNSTISENRLFFLCVLSKKKGGWPRMIFFILAFASSLHNKQQHKQKGEEGINKVCERCVILLVYSLSLHRHSYIGFILAFDSSIHNNKQTKINK